MPNHLYIVHGDIAQLAADAVVYSTSNYLAGDGLLYDSFVEHVEGFDAALEAQRAAWTGREPGEAFWLELPRDAEIKAGRRRPGVVVAITVGNREPGVARVRRAVPRAIEIAVESLRARGVTRHLLVAFPMLLGGAGGGYKRRAELARAQLEAALEALGAHERVDVALVAFSAEGHRTLLEARRSVEAAGSVAGRTEAPPVGLLDALWSREAVLFVGSGLSASAGLPSWENLVRRLASDAGIAVPDATLEVDALLDLAQSCRAGRATRGESGGGVREAVCALFGREATRGHLPTLAHYQLASLPFQYVVTTNYDALIERALTALRRHHRAVHRDQDTALTGQGHCVSVVKLHGDADGDDIVVSREDYDGYFEAHPAKAALLQGLLLNQSFVFVGYSLRDPDFQQIYRQIERMLGEARRPAFATTFGGATDGVLREDQKLVSLAFDGDAVEDKERALWAWLDRLGDAVMGGVTPLLTPSRDPEVVSAPMRPMREQLLALGETVERLAGEELAEGDALQVAALLNFLVELGWRRATNEPLGELWARIARRVSPRERARVVRRALEQADHLADAEALRALLPDDA